MLGFQRWLVEAAPEGLKDIAVVVATLRSLESAALSVLAAMVLSLTPLKKYAGSLAVVACFGAFAVVVWPIDALREWRAGQGAATWIRSAIVTLGVFPTIPPLALCVAWQVWLVRSKRSASAAPLVSVAALQVIQALYLYSFIGELGRET